MMGWFKVVAFVVEIISIVVMVWAIHRIGRELQSKNEENITLRAALSAAIAQYDGYPPEVLAEIAPEWLDMGRRALTETTRK